MAARVLKGMDDIAFCNLTSKDVVRHPLVQKIVQAYETFEAREEARSRQKDERLRERDRDRRGRRR